MNNNIELINMLINTYKLKKYISINYYRNNTWCLNSKGDVYEICYFKNNKKEKIVHCKYLEASFLIVLEIIAINKDHFNFLKDAYLSILCNKKLPEYPNIYNDLIKLVEDNYLVKYNDFLDIPIQKREILVNNLESNKVRKRVDK